MKKFHSKRSISGDRRFLLKLENSICSKPFLTFAVINVGGFAVWAPVGARARVVVRRGGALPSPAAASEALPNAEASHHEDGREKQKDVEPGRASLEDGDGRRPIHAGVVIAATAGY